MPNIKFTAQPVWLTTGEAARMLQLTADGVRWLARSKRLRGERTPSGQWFFRAADVEVVVKRRANVRGGLVIVPPSIGRSGEPRQLPLFVGWERKVAMRSHSEEVTNGSEICRESNNGRSVDLPAVEARR